MEIRRFDHLLYLKLPMLKPKMFNRKDAMHKSKRYAVLLAALVGTAATSPFTASFTPAAQADTVKKEGHKSSATSSSRTLMTADRAASKDTQAILALIRKIVADKRLVAGQELGENESGTEFGVKAGYSKYVDGLGKNAGKCGLVGADYGYSYLPYKGTALEVNQTLIQHWNKGGLVTVCDHLQNPWTSGGAKSKRPPDVDLDELMKPGTAANRAWMLELDEVAEGLGDLQKKGVVCLWRPFHEMNGRWFWWGGSAKLPDLWRFTFNYLTNQKGLHNLLWVYAPSPRTAKRPNVMAQYPGDEFVDVVGLDIYEDDFTDDSVQSYKQLVQSGKPFALTEFGPGNSSGNLGTYDYSKLVPQLRSKLPASAYFMAWTDWSSPNPAKDQKKSMRFNQNADALLNDPEILSLEELRRLRQSSSPKQSSKHSHVAPK